MKRLEENDIEMYSIYNEGKPAVSEKLILLKYMTSISKMCILMN